MQQLFSELDPHKKSFLSPDDWALAFGSFHWEDHQLHELKDSIGCFFPDVESAFEFFISFRRNASALGYTRAPDALSEILFEEDFKAGVRSLTSGRYSEDDLLGLWNMLLKCKEGGGRSIGFAEFRRLFDSVLKTSFVGKKTGSFGLNRLTSSSGARTSSMGRTTNSSLKSESGLVERFKNMLRVSKKDLRQLLQARDASRCGRLPVAEVKAVVLSMKLGVNGRDVEKLLAPFSVFADGMVDYLEFERRFRGTESAMKKP